MLMISAAWLLIFGMGCFCIAGISKRNEIVGVRGRVLLRLIGVACIAFFIYVLSRTPADYSLDEDASDYYQYERTLP